MTRPQMLKMLSKVYENLRWGKCSLNDYKAVIDHLVKDYEWLKLLKEEGYDTYEYYDSLL